MSVIELDENNHAGIRDLLMGRRIVAAEKGKVPIPWDDDDTHRWFDHAEGVLTLDNGTRIYARGNDGGCSCGAGDYALTHLATVDNVITSVRFEDNPDDDDSPDIGWYAIFVVADATEINIAKFEGTDGNGYYGTGYSLYVKLPDPEPTP